MLLVKVVFVSFQHHQWLRSAAEGRAQTVSGESFDSSSYRQEPLTFPCTGTAPFVLKHSDESCVCSLPAVLILSVTLLLFLQLAYCIVQFLEKDPALTEPVSAVFH